MNEFVQLNYKMKSGPSKKQEPNKGRPTTNNNAQKII